MLTREEIDARRAAATDTLARLTDARHAALAALEELTPRLESATQELGRVGLAARLGERPSADAKGIGAAVADLERQRAEHQATAAEAARQIAVAEAELALLDTYSRRLAYQAAVEARNAHAETVKHLVAELAPALNELWRLEAVAVDAADRGGIQGHPRHVRRRIWETLQHELGEFVPASRRWSLDEILNGHADNAEAALAGVAS